MSQSCKFSSGLELANLVVNSELLHRSWDAISDLEKRSCTHVPDLPLSVEYKECEHPGMGTIVAFACPSSVNVQQLERVGTDLVSADEIAGFFSMFDFVRTKVNPSFSVHKAAASLFSSHIHLLSLLKEKHGNSSPLIITGQSMGGSIASLFTLWLLGDIPTKATKRPLCVTFGSPLLVGTFLFCSERDGDSACFEEPRSVVQLMLAMSSELEEEQRQKRNLQNVDYGLILERLKHYNPVRKEYSPLHQSNINPLEAETMIQLEAIGVERLQGNQGNHMTTSLIANVASWTEDYLTQRRNIFDPTKKLNDIKIDMTYLEWYKKVSIEQGGYYDSYKLWRWKSRDEIKSRHEIMKRKRILTRYWRGIVDEAEQMPQKEGWAFRTRGLYAGTNYRRMVEPLDIAEYYGEGKKDYLTQGRPKHYRLLEQWLNEDKQPGTGNRNSRSKACSLTEDSCFWAHVEEATLCCNALKDGQSSLKDRETSRKRLVEFEQYAMDLINNYSVSVEVFLEQSSFMQWWNGYSELIDLIGGFLCQSPLRDFMKNKRYRNYA
ncbi:senescence-associated carboxylesterase 101 isoform X1 [Coffea eugenioides]|uniref:senescence-associated carboxylesterase 101 isoform X1 n=1 Tax=Coffea eugenioides TaxID=49369 RepID=UPI000F606DAF|nr:senescence-associated carboxylesterase 101 isoform X1 [Coffea eugenioides]